MWLVCFAHVFFLFRKERKNTFRFLKIFLNKFAEDLGT